MSDRINDNAAGRDALSALADGESTASDVARACASWKDSAQARAAWHDYHLIGDVMRSEDLAEASGSEAFLRNFRSRLAQEPVVLAPQPSTAQRAAAAEASAAPRKRLAWAGPFAVAAGFVMVVGALVSSQIIPPGTGAESGQMAYNTALPPGLQVAQPGGALTSAWASSDTSFSLAGPSFSRPEPVAQALARDAQVDPAWGARRAAVAADASFASQSNLAKQVVFSLP
jgi:sigma-E factor negative regulatory protein RseA